MTSYWPTIGKLKCCRAIVNLVCVFAYHWSFAKELYLKLQRGFAYNIPRNRYYIKTWMTTSIKAKH